MATGMGALVRAGYYASYALLVHVKPCGVHVLSPREIDKYLSSIIAAVGFSSEAAEIGRSIAQGRLEPGNTGLGRLFFNATRAGYTSAKQLCPDTLFSQLIAAASYGYVVARSTPSPSSISRAMKTIMDYLGPDDTKHFLKGLEASAANTLLSTLYDEGITSTSIASYGQNLTDIIYVLSKRIGGVYSALANPSTIVYYSSTLAKSFTRRTIIAVWLEIAKDCIPREILSKAITILERIDDEPQKSLRQLLELDAKCRERQRCSTHLPTLLLAAYISALITE